MPDPNPVRTLLLSLTTAATGAVALVLSLTGTNPSVGLPAAPSLTGAATVTQARVVPDALDPAEVLRSQAAAGLDCAMSAAGVPLCLHGEDEAQLAGAAGGSTATPRGGPLGCYGDGTSGPRVRAVYARPASAPDRYAASVGAIREWAAGINSTVDASATRTKGHRYVRFATTPGRSCVLTVLDVVLPDTAFVTFRATIDALQAAGLDARYSKYLVWSDASGYCGMATTYADDSPGLDNLNNGGLPAYARVDRRCWGKVETHELVHMLGGVQRSAPNATAGFHCSDGRDILCYDDGSSGSAQRQVCGQDRAHLLDCRNDDYFSTAAPRGSYLQTHWNTARSSYLAATLAESSPAPVVKPSPSASPAPVVKPSPSASPTTAPEPPSSPSPSPSSSRPGLPPLPLPTLLPLVTR